MPCVRAAYSAAATADISGLPHVLLSQLSFDAIPDNEERDELRAVLLLHHINSIAAQQEQGPRNAHGKRFALELACEPADVYGLQVCCEDLALPPQLLLSNCSVGRFARSSRCSLLCKAGSQHVQVGGTVLSRRRRLQGHTSVLCMWKT
jgi:hypothetical protein